MFIWLLDLTSYFAREYLKLFCKLLIIDALIGQVGLLKLKPKTKRAVSLLERLGMGGSISASLRDDNKEQAKADPLGDDERKKRLQRQGLARKKVTFSSIAMRLRWMGHAVGIVQGRRTGNGKGKDRSRSLRDDKQRTGNEQDCVQT